MSEAGSALKPGPLDRRLITLARPSNTPLAVALLCALVQLATHIGVAVVLAHLFSNLLGTSRLSDSTTPLIELTLLFALSLAAQFAMTTALGRVSRQAMSHLTTEVLTQVARGRELSQERSGGLAIALTSGLTPLEGYFSKYLPTLVQSILTPLVLLTVVVVLDPLAALILVLGLIAMPVITAKVATRATASAAKQWRALYSLSARYSELLHGLTTLRLLNATSRAKREVDEATKNYAAATMSALRLAFQSSLAAEFSTGVAIGLTAMVVGFQLLAGKTSVAVAFTILLVAAEVYAPLRRTSAEFHNAASGSAAAATLFQLLDEVPEQPLEGVTFHPETTTLSLAAASVPLQEGRSTTPLTTTLCAGEVLVVSGDSGTGKSTLLQAIAKALGQSASFMPQRIHVFSATVTENLVLDGRRVGDRELDAACHVTGFHHVVDQLPQGLNTVLGDGGVALSAGELRKLGLTRALLADRPVIILDEPTANLDEASLEYLIEGFGHAVEHRIVILSAHGQPPLLAPTLLHVVEEAT